MAATRATTDRMIAELRARGLEVHDRRGTLGNYPTRNTGQFIGVHWTGDNFGRVIPPTNDLAADLKLAEFYRWYHMEGGHNWPGIAYAVLIMPSARVLVCHDLDRLTYHAFNANAAAVGVSFPNSNNAEPPPGQLRAGLMVLDWLCFDCPELAAGQGEVYGHKELAFLDARNAGTACPGTFTRHVQAYRGRGERMYPATGGNAPVLREEEDEVREPAANNAAVYVNSKGETIAVANFGGVAVKADANFADLGVTVENARGERYDRTLRGGVMLPWSPSPPK